MTAPLTGIRHLTLAFAGNPNVGKSALINALANSQLKVGNWPGVTVEKKEARLFYRDCQFQIVDLPGTYSLNPFTVEEQVCRDFLLQNRPDLIVNVLDPSNLEKSLYLSMQLIEMEIPMVFVLNLWDEFEDRGYTLDLNALALHLGAPVVKTIGKTGEGVDTLKEAILVVVNEPNLPNAPVYPAGIEHEIQQLLTKLSSHNFASAFPPRWLAIRLLEGDTDTLDKIQQQHGFDARPLSHEAREHLQIPFPHLDQTLKRTHQDQISELSRYAVPPPQRRPDWSDRLDAFLLNEWTGIPAFLAVLFAVFKLTFDISTPFVDWIDGFFNGFLARWIGIGLTSLQTPQLLISLIQEGLIGGVGLVLTFVPILMFLYLFLAILEESGYMSRAAFLMDRFMFRFGLHGKSFVPLLVGYGCNVPAVYATRALENQSDRRITAAVLSFMSCGAKLPIYALFTAVFFTRHQALIIVGLYLLGIAVAISWAIVLRHTRFKSEIPAFVMELPPYRLPSFKMLWASIWLKTKAFIQQAGTVIAISMLLLWSLVNLPYGAAPENTVLGYSARMVAPVFLPQGFGQHWQAVAAILPGFMAKEMVVGTLGVVLSVEQKEDAPETAHIMQEFSQEVQGLGQAAMGAASALVGNILPTPFVVAEEEASPLTQAVRETFTPLSALSFMIFNLLLISCISVVGAMTQEFGVRYLGFVFALTTGTAYFVSMLVYQLGYFLGGN